MKYVGGSFFVACHGDDVYGVGIFEKDRMDMGRAGKRRKECSDDVY